MTAPGRMLGTATVTAPKPQMVTILDDDALSMDLGRAAGKIVRSLAVAERVIPRRAGTHRKNGYAHNPARCLRDGHCRYREALRASFRPRGLN
jgi:hypothetical protein